MQLSFEKIARISRDAYDYGQRSSGETHGLVLTKPHVVELILGLAGYAAERDLTETRLLEPSCGHGAFLLPAVERLVAAARARRVPVSRLGACIRAFDIDESHVMKTRAAVFDVLRRAGVTAKTADNLVAQWIHAEDFLLAHHAAPFDVIIGNPPYIRIEQLSLEIQVEYRRRYESLYDRADLYVAFIEQSLRLLASGGVLSFVCSDRWTANRYGAPLRRLVTEQFALETYIDLHAASPFESEVTAYPSIFAIRRSSPGPVRVLKLETANPEECAAAAAVVRGEPPPGPAPVIEVHARWFQGDEPWVITPPGILNALRRLEAEFAPIETDGKTRVGIGVATGNDKVYIVDDTAPIEADRLVPLVMRADIEQGQIRDARRCVINTFGKDGRVVDLADYPRLAKYLARHVDTVRGRHVAKAHPNAWFRTIDRVYPSLVGTPKLLIPDIAGANQVAYDAGRFHPHHNLYYITSSSWDLEVLGALLSSRVALFFVWCYGVKMRGGYLRFQAQYLRRIRLPRPDSISEVLGGELREAFRRRDFERIDRLALQAYGLRSLPEFDFVDTRA